ncbi:MAG: hypothetical protein ACE362_05445 [Phaeodactylibacter xiamenensis]|uniref:hypothetical protein n=1 Tax=Phaeodactylibacter xiamenensis TaxID=1524460 RepID=UPI001EE74350|nr:hypothetical protein [Phaeodactylibacter xiamenensis]
MSMTIITTTVTIITTGMTTTIMSTPMAMTTTIVGMTIIMTTVTIITTGMTIAMTTAGRRWWNWSRTSCIAISCWLSVTGGILLPKICWRLIW